LRERALFILSGPDGLGAVVSAEVDDLGNWTRLALQWQGTSEFQIHAREFGAGYGDPGHVWAGAPANRITGSFLTRLGDDTGDRPRSVENYSFPHDSGLNGSVDLTVETEVNVDNCGRSVTAEALERRGAGTLHSHGLDLDMPDCGAIGDFLVLNNFLDDLKVATN
ncbi:unnamed protein product, partial [Ectocarpus sp. 12 AP-2014]